MGRGLSPLQQAILQTAAENKGVISTRQVVERFYGHKLNRRGRQTAAYETARSATERAVRRLQNRGLVKETKSPCSRCPYCGWDDDCPHYQGHTIRRLTDVGWELVETSKTVMVVRS